MMSEVNLENSDSLVANENQPRWFATYLWSNQEKAIDKRLRLKGIETFLPLLAAKKRWKNRVTANVETPMFPGYLFVRIEQRQYVRVLEVPMVHSIVGNGREYLEVDGAIIEALRTGLREGKVSQHPNLKEGSRARVSAGPFAGLEGVIDRVNNQLQVVLSIDQIGKCFALHVGADEVELLRP
jgi:transcription antitermination factor NusG